MPFDKNLPSGGDKAKLLDDTTRANFAALETALASEHDFLTGGAQTGRHKFGIGNTASRDAQTGMVTGSIWFNTGLRVGGFVLQIKLGSTWFDLDVYQPATIPRINEQIPYIVTQWSNWTSVTPTAGSPNTLTVALGTSSACALKYATITADTKLSNPTGAVSGAGTTCVFDILIGGAGGYNFTFDTQYRAANGLKPIVSTAVGSKTRLYIESLQDGTYLVSSKPAIGAIP